MMKCQIPLFIHVLSKLAGIDASTFILVYLSEHAIFEEQVIADVWLCHNPQTAEFTESSCILVLSACNPELLIELRYAIVSMSSTAATACMTEFV